MAIMDVEKMMNAVGEISWHSLTVDPSIDEVSRRHADEIRVRLDTTSGKTIRFLEVGAYAHYSADILANDLPVEATVTDISSSTLALGRRHAVSAGLDPSAVRRVAADFHDLPFENGSFDFVFIASALHHTWTWKTVLRELFRVTASGGQVFLMNEPVKRAFCFYGFRTNRPNQFRPVEQALFDTGVLRCVAEPYLGSRPETLFGMVENQLIDIDEFMGEIREEAEIVQSVFDTGPTMSPEDTEAFAARERPETCRAIIETHLTKGVAAARAVYTETDRELGIMLPDAGEISEMARKTAALMTEAGAHPLGPEVGQAAIFGAAVQITARKKPGGKGRDIGEFVWGSSDGIDTAFRSHVA